MDEWIGWGHMGGMWFWWFFGFVIIAVLAWAIIMPSSRKDDDTGMSAEELLKRRYARGDITKDDYESRLEDLRK